MKHRQTPETAPRRKKRSYLIKQADRLCSLFVRQSRADKEGNAKCFTCPYVGNWKKLQNGHYISRWYKYTRWHHDNMRPQCLTENSSVRLFDGNQKSIRDVKIGDELLGFNEKTFVKEKCIVEDHRRFMADDLYEVELANGEKFFATSDHKVVANGKWFAIGEMLHDCTAYDILEI